MKIFLKVTSFFKGRLTPNLELRVRNIHFFQRIEYSIHGFDQSGLVRPPSGLQCIEFNVSYIITLRQPLEKLHTNYVCTRRRDVASAFDAQTPRSKSRKRALSVDPNFVSIRRVTAAGRVPMHRWCAWSLYALFVDATPTRACDYETVQTHSDG